MFFFDTYAIIEIWHGNPAYQKYGNETIFTSILNVGELYYALLKEGTKETSDARISSFKPSLIEVDQETMKKAMLFRYNHKRKKLSMVDCVGYTLSQKMGIPFLTGDQAFQALAGVEYIT